MASACEKNDMVSGLCDLLMKGDNNYWATSIISIS